MFAFLNFQSQNCADFRRPLAGLPNSFDCDWALGGKVLSYSNVNTRSYDNSTSRIRCFSAFDRFLSSSTYPPACLRVAVLAILLRVFW